MPKSVCVDKLTLADITAVIDTREQTPLDLAPMQMTSAALNVADYSVKGLEHVIAIERKSLGDLLACCGRERPRFQRELDRLRGWPVNVVVIESSWHEIEMGGWRSRLTPKQVVASLTSWIAQGHVIVMAGNHAMAGKIVRDILFYATRYRLRELEGLTLESAHKKSRLGANTSGNVLTSVRNFCGVGTKQ